MIKTSSRKLEPITSIICSAILSYRYPPMSQALAEALQQNRLTELVLDHNQLGPRGAEARWTLLVVVIQDEWPKDMEATESYG